MSRRTHRRTNRGMRRGLGRRRQTSDLPHARGETNVWIVKPTSVGTLSCVGEGGTLKCMQLSTGISFLAVAQASKSFAVRCGWIDTNMSKTAVFFGASACLEMLARRRVVRRCSMRQLTVAVGASTLEEKRLAYGLCIRIMPKWTSRDGTPT